MTPGAAYYRENFEGAFTFTERKSDTRDAHTDMGRLASSYQSQ